MPSGSADRRYAQAVFELARASNKLDDWAGDLSVIKQVFQDPQIQVRLGNPKVTRDQKVELVTKILKESLNPAALNLALLLVKRSRQDNIGGIVEDYSRLVNKLRGIEVAEVTTAVPIGEAEEAAIIRQLASITGKQVQIIKKVDPAIIGGLVARIGDTILDGSVTSRLQALRKSLA